MAVIMSNSNSGHVVIEGWNQDICVIEDPNQLEVLSKQSCSTVVFDFIRETAKFYALSINIGCSYENERLLRELFLSRSKAMRLAATIYINLVRMSKQKLDTTQDEQDVERLHRLFSSCSELLLTSFYTTYSLQAIFGFDRKDDVYVHTGVSDPFFARRNSYRKTGEIFSVDGTFSEEIICFNHFNELSSMIHGINQKFDIQPWDVRPECDIKKNDKSIYYELEFSSDFITIHEPNLRRRRRCICITVVIVTVIAIAGVLIGLTLPLTRSGT